MGTDFATGGGGSLVTFLMQGLGGLREIAQEGKKLGPDKVKDLLAETKAQLTSSGPIDTRSRDIMGGGAAAAPKSPLQWDDVDMEEFFAARIEDQPEIAALDQVIHELENEILPHHGHLSDNYDQKITAGKIEAALENGSYSYDGVGVVLASGSLQDLAIQNLGPNTGFSSDPESKDVVATLESAWEPGAPGAKEASFNVSIG